MTITVEAPMPPANARHSSATDDWGTPVEILDAARETLGTIDLDPASSTRHNHRVRAVVFFGDGGLVSNGFTTSWAGRIFLNPPGGRCDADGLRVVKDCVTTGACGLPSSSITRPAGHTHKAPIGSAAKAWWWKLAEEWHAGRVEMALFLMFSLELFQSAQVRESWVESAWSEPMDHPFCVFSRRLAFIGSDDEPQSGMTHASAAVFLPPKHWGKQAEAVARFERAFASLGRCR